MEILKQQEVLIIGMALSQIIEDLDAKLEKNTGMDLSLPPYMPGDENDFITKES